MNLEGLLHPVGARAFITQYWETQPLVLDRGEPRYFEPLLTLQDVDHILAHSSVRSSDIRIVTDGHEIPLTKLQRTPGSNQAASGLEALYQHYRDGSTIILVSLHERWPPLRDLCRTLTNELSADVQANIYLTPPSRQGLNAHYDTHDVIVLQVADSKRWRVSPGPIELPTPDQPPAGDLIPYLSASSGREFCLDPGDAAYIPRGFVHAATSVDRLSIHITLGIRTLTWGSVLLDSVRDSMQTCRDLRQSLPPGFALDPALQGSCNTRFREVAGAALEQLEGEVVVDAACRSGGLLMSRPFLEGHLVDLEFSGLLQATTALRVRVTVGASVIVDSDFVSLGFHGKRVRMPLCCKSSLDFMLVERRFAANDLPDELAPDEKLTLIRRLLEEGFLSVQE